MLLEWMLLLVMGSLGLNICEYDNEGKLGTPEVNAYIK